MVHLVSFGAHASHAGIASDIPSVNIGASGSPAPS
jgi:hypothetical protein